MARSRIKVGNIDKVSGEVNIAGRDVIKNIKTIHQRALTAAEEAARGRKLESKLLAQGIGTLAQSLSAQASEGTESDNPYKGLLSYSLNEAEIFYGRNEARKDLLNCLKQGPLTVLHAESGAGKSSLLQAGIAAQLIANGHLAIHLRAHNTSPVDFIKRMFLPELTQAPTLAGASLHEFLRQVGAVLGPKVNLYLLLDQFEEFFNLLNRDERQLFLESLADCLNDPSLKVRWVFALRAEALSKLAELEAFGIAPFKNMYRLNRLNRAEARQAIIEPASRYGIAFEPALIDHMLDTLTTNDEVIPTHLQLVCSALTDDLPEDKTLTLTFYTEHEGGTEGILRDYLKRRLEDLPVGEQALAWKVLRALITADRQRAVKTSDEIIQELKNSDGSKEQINTILARLIERRLLFTQPATTETFELAHDYLVKEIQLDPQEQARKAAQELLDQETRTYERHRTLLSPERLAVIEPFQSELRISADADSLLSESRKAVLQEQLARERRRKITLAITSSVAVAMALLAFWGFSSSQAAKRQAKIAHSRELAAYAAAVQDQHFDLSLLLSIEAFKIDSNTQTKSILLDNTQTNLQLRQYLRSPVKSISSMVFSPDSKSMALGSCATIDSIGFCDQGAIILFDVMTGQSVGQPILAPVSPVAGRGSITSVAFSRDGKTLVSGGDLGDIILWDAHSGKPIGRPLQEVTAQPVSSLAFSPDGKTLASAMLNLITLWDLTTRQPIGQPLEDLRSGSIVPGSLVFSSDGMTLTAASPDGLVKWDLAIHQMIGRPFSLNLNTFPNMAFSPDGKTLALSDSANNSINLWDLTTYQMVDQDLSGHSDQINALAFSPDGKTLASSDSDGNIILWDKMAHQPLSKLLEGNYDQVSNLVFSSDSKTLISSNIPGNIIFWDTKTQQPLGKPFLVESSEVVFSPDGKILASYDSVDEKITLWDTSNHLTITEMKAQYVTSLVFGKSNKVLATGNLFGTIDLWDTVTGKPISKPLKLDNEPSITGLAFSQDGQILAIAGEEIGGIILWDITTDKPSGQTLKAQSSYIRSLVFSPNSRILAAGYEDATVILWNVLTHQAIGQPLKGHSGRVTSLAFSSDGNILATGSCIESENHPYVCIQGEIFLWDVTTGQSLIHQPLKGHGGLLDSLTFSTDGITLASGGCGTDSNGNCANGEIILWNLNPKSWLQINCQRAGRNFTRAEWAQYVPFESYPMKQEDATCPQWSLELESTPTPSTTP